MSRFLTSRQLCTSFIHRWLRNEDFFVTVALLKLTFVRISRSQLSHRQLISQKRVESRREWRNYPATLSWKGRQENKSVIDNFKCYEKFCWRIDRLYRRLCQQPTELKSLRRFSGEAEKAKGKVTGIRGFSTFHFCLVSNLYCTRKVEKLSICFFQATSRQSWLFTLDSSFFFVLVVSPLRKHVKVSLEGSNPQIFVHGNMSKSIQL